MNIVVAVEDNLGPVKDYLADRGCRLVDMKRATQSDVKAVVISGSDADITGMQTMVAQVPVINARGQSPQEIWERIQDKIMQ